MVVPTSIISARAFDVSSDGFGLSNFAREIRDMLDHGDAVWLKVPDGRKLEGHIAWVAGSRAGATLTTLLAKDDSLMAEAFATCSQYTPPIWSQA